MTLTTIGLTTKIRIYN